ncbi:MAG: hypothetical protein A4E24_00258 [Methanomethylovorans sp. PtaU1.Bin093]|jgi:hypothetical protein|uniref:COG1361 S-layer family protein n=1 Tax=Methanomethylovorans sp. PtaU1.Bin093 TaxID=1811679 RepID=UPI0009D56284|nr:hypothetical protein [Methanomethylovorans sp. PtaU1.Bin093]OPY21968.1 MAG: hypothetical protein A4E24_00258 [Methanomethylovorans sp. PtaU1.Bin093]
MKNENDIMRTIIFFFILLTMFLPYASADTEIRPTITVNYSVEPGVFMPGDTGTVTVELRNMASGEVYVQEDDETFDMNAYIASATLKGNKGIKILDGRQTDVGLLGPGDYIRLTFNIKANESAANGMHFLELEVVGGSDMYNLNYRIPVKVDDRDLKIIVSDMPPTLMKEYSTVNVEVVNLRPNDITGVIVTPEGKDITFFPANVFVGTINEGNKSTATFTLNSMTSKNGNKEMQFSATYFNGDNPHISSGTNYNVEVVDQYALILSALEVERIGNTYSITGDINNFGTTDAKNVMISVTETENITPVQPYEKYFVGTLESDDFSSFELSASTQGNNVEKIPLLIEFRNTNNAYAYINEDIVLHKGTLPASSNSGGTRSVMIGLVAVISVAVLGVIAYSWKKRKISE